MGRTGGGPGRCRAPSRSHPDVLTLAATAGLCGDPIAEKELRTLSCSGIAMDERVMREAARSGNLELVQWLRAEGCAWDWKTCYRAVGHGHVEVLRWARENGCPWSAGIRDWAARELGYTDDFGNLQ